ncbi:MAG: class I SAM-dependent methyltransferase [Bacteriovoracaceae bacterium]|nr:class I SAM-dependent methyltransferase [Bacteriovoracaceae bacterium]
MSRLLALVILLNLEAWANTCDDKIRLSGQVTIYNDKIAVTYEASPGQIETSYYTPTNRSLNELLTANKIFPAIYSKDSLTPKKWQNKKVLDAGCGNGKVVHNLRELGVDAEGLDIKFLNLPKNQIPENVFGASMLDIPKPRNHYDIILSTFSVLSLNGSLELKRLALKELMRVLKVGGELKISPLNKADFLAMSFLIPGLKIKAYRLLQEKPTLTALKSAKQLADLPNYSLYEWVITKAP